MDVDCGQSYIRTSFNLLNGDAATFTQAGTKNMPCIVRFPFNLQAHFIVTTPYDGVALERVMIQGNDDIGEVTIWFGEQGTGRVNVTVY